MPPAPGLAILQTNRPALAPNLARRILILRTWRGATRVDDSDAYVDYLERTGLSEYRGTPGNRGAMLLRRPGPGNTEFLILSFWDSMDAVRRFAGEDWSRAVFYPEDERFLVERDMAVHHFEDVTVADDTVGRAEGFARVWRFDAAPGRAHELERALAPDGPWGDLFREAPGFRSIRLFRSLDVEGRFLTVDEWQDRDAWETFRLDRGREYDDTDRGLAPLARQEKDLGDFERVV